MEPVSGVSMVQGASRGIGLEFVSHFRVQQFQGLRSRVKSINCAWFMVFFVSLPVVAEFSFLHLIRDS